MALTHKQLQKKKAKKATKNKQSKFKNRIVINEGAPVVSDQQLQWPIYECWCAERFEQPTDLGLAYVFITRKGPNSKVLVGVFFLDIYCLGVRGSTLTVVPEEEYRDMLNPAKEFEELKIVEPAYAIKLIEDAADYAKTLELRPHKNYRYAKQIFGDIDKTTCSKSFVFGCNGKPAYLITEAEPNSADITETLLRTCGSDGFKIIVSA